MHRTINFINYGRKSKKSVLALLDAAEAELKAGNTAEAAAKIAEAKDEIKRPIGGGNNGRPGAE